MGGGGQAGGEGEAGVTVFSGCTAKQVYVQLLEGDEPKVRERLGTNRSMYRTGQNRVGAAGVA